MLNSNSGTWQDYTACILACLLLCWVAYDAYWYLTNNNTKLDTNTESKKPIANEFRPL